MEQKWGQREEEAAFLAVCCEHDRDMLQGRARMTLQDFDRILYLTIALGFIGYACYIQLSFPDLMKRYLEQMERENSIMEEHPEYFVDAEIGETHQKWMDDFCNQIPEHLREKYIDLIYQNLPRI